MRPARPARSRDEDEPVRRPAEDVFAGLSAQRGRVLLMASGLTVAVALLSAVIVIGQGTRARIMGLVEKHGLDMLMVRAGGDVQVFAPQAADLNHRTANQPPQAACFAHGFGWHVVALG